MKPVIPSTFSPFTSAAFAAVFGFFLFLVPAQAIIIDGIDWTSTWEGNVQPNANGGNSGKTFFYSIWWSFHCE